MVLTSSGATRASRRLYSAGLPLESKAACGALALVEGIAGRFAGMRG